MQDIFITKIQINKVRHLEDIEIGLSESQKRHLILTGKNGSGKTSLIERLSEAFSISESSLQWEFGNDGKHIRTMQQYIDNIGLKVYCNAPCSNSTELYSKMYEEGLIHALSANRKLTLQLPKSIEAIDVDKDVLYSDIFLKYLLYLNYQRINAITNNDEDEANNVQQWFDMFLQALREIYDCSELELIHNSKDLSFKIFMPDREPFGLNEMADGYSSFLYIVIELIMKMEKTASMTYDMPGIVLIDEIETHLHVELQKRILPFLINMFPRIQFIVTTHSPFVITSVSNAVVYDLEKKIAIEDMSAYSYEAVIEHYYDVNMYSREADKQFEIYNSLVKKDNLSPDEMESLVNAMTYLKQIPAGAAEELVYSFREMEAQRRLPMNDQNK